MLRKNQITTPPPICPLKCCLENLIIDSNSILKISKNFLMGFRKLKVFDLSSNNIFQLPDLHWVQHTLQEIKANKNNLSSLDALHTHIPFKSLHYITLGMNNIQSFNVSLMRQLTRWTDFHLYSNKLSYVDDFRSYHIKSINLLGNPWHCDASLSWMGEEDMAFEKGLTCATPSCLHGMAIADLSKYNMHIPHNGQFSLYSVQYTTRISYNITSLWLWFIITISTGIMLINV